MTCEAGIWGRHIRASKGGLGVKTEGWGRRILVVNEDPKVSNSPTSAETMTVSEGLAVVHLFCKRKVGAVDVEIIEAIERAERERIGVVKVAILGHKADMCFMARHREPWRLRAFQTALQKVGLEVVDSFVSISEISEYAEGLSDEMKDLRLYPPLPPTGKAAWCFYPMTKRRGESQNWYQLSFEERKALMMEHGASGRKFAGRIVQWITSATGLDDWEWGVTLFGTHLDDLKDAVYTMRYDTASAKYAEFGPFYTGIVGTTRQVVFSTRIPSPSTNAP